MANTSQKLIDSERRVVYKWTGNTAEPAVVKIDAGGLNFSLNANNQLLGTGQTQQALAQRQLDAAYQQWQQAMAFPYQQAAF